VVLHRWQELWLSRDPPNGEVHLRFLRVWKESWRDLYPALEIRLSSSIIWLFQFSYRHFLSVTEWIELSLILAAQVSHKGFLCEMLYQAMLVTSGMQVDRELRTSPTFNKFI
jgi:hypothetical protein